MELFFTLLPIYIFGNGHCLGMCGPLVMLIGRHQYAWAYFIGRALSFSLAAMLASSIGLLMQPIITTYLFPGAYAIILGVILVIMPLLSYLVPKIGSSSVGAYLSTLALQNSVWPMFLFGFATALIPCGQSLVVFSACSLAPSIAIAGLNGLAFAIFTSPSLFLAMNIHKLLNVRLLRMLDITRYLTILIGVLFIWRGLQQLSI